MFDDIDNKWKLMFVVMVIVCVIFVMTLIFPHTAAETAKGSVLIVK